MRTPRCLRSHFLFTAFLAIMVLVIGVNHEASAQVTEFTIDPEEPLVGHEVTCEAGDAGNQMVESYTWKLQFVTPGCNGVWTTFGDENEAMFGCPFPGTYNIELTVTYEAEGEPVPVKPDPSTIPLQIIVPVPDGISIVDGWLGVPILHGQGIMAEYQIESGGKAVGFNVGGLAQERVTDQFVGPELEPMQDTNWSPLIPTSVFYMEGGVIFDLHDVNVENLWEDIEVGQVFYKFKQHMRIVWRDPCQVMAGQGAVWVYPQPPISFDLQRRKVSPTEWQLELQ